MFKKLTIKPTKKAPSHLANKHLIVAALGIAIFLLNMFALKVMRRQKSYNLNYIYHNSGDCNNLDLFFHILMQFQINLLCLTRVIKCHIAWKPHLDCQENISLQNMI